MTQVFQDRNYNVQKRLSEVLPNQQSHQKYSALVQAAVIYHILSLQFYTYRAGVRKRRCGEAVWRLSATVSPAYRIGLRERRRGENVCTRPTSPLDSQTVGSCR